MCYINIYPVTRNQVLLLIKPKVFDFFPLICYEKNVEIFFSVNVKRAKIQTMARKHAHSDQVQKVVGLITNEPSAIFFFVSKSRRGRAFRKIFKKAYLTQGRF